MRFYWFWGLFIGLLSFHFIGQSQSVYVPFSQDYYHLLNRYEVLSGRTVMGSTQGVKPYKRKDVALFADSLLADSTLKAKFSPRDWFNLRYLLQDNIEFASDSSTKPKENKGLIGLYKSSNAGFRHSSKDLEFQINPIWQFQVGQEQGRASRLFINSRGFETRAMIDGKVGLYMMVTENQMRLPSYVDTFVRDFGVVPGEGFWKRVGTDVNSFFTTRGYITAAITKHIDMQFGHDKLFFGNGMRSMILSDFSNNHTFLKLNTNVWRIEYTNVYSQMMGNTPAIRTTGSFPGIRYDNKYFVLHRLGLALGKRRNFNIGINEAVIFSRGDSLNQLGFDVGYLVPVIFYRAIESNYGSPDNAMIAFDFNWNLWKRIQLYGQLNLDEFLFDEVFGGRGWWANKRGFQLGGKYFNALGIKNLDLQLEYNSVTPYTFTHQSNRLAYTHYNMAIAHPLGANFRELVGAIRYQPLGRLQFSLTGMLSRQGKDANPTIDNWGGNVLKSYLTRERDFGNFNTQGTLATTVLIDAQLSYMFYHNMFLDVGLLYRKQSYLFPKDMQVLNVGFRVNMNKRQHIF